MIIYQVGKQEGRYADRQRWIDTGPQKKLKRHIYLHTYTDFVI